MRLRGAIMLSVLVIAILFPLPGFAHTPMCSCFDNGDGTITCEGGFSDGSSAAGVKIRIKDKNGKVLLDGEMDEFSEFIFDKPSGSYTVVFEAGPGHEVEIKGKDIAE